MTTKNNKKTINQTSFNQHFNQLMDYEIELRKKLKKGMLGIFEDEEWLINKIEREYVKIHNIHFPDDQLMIGLNGIEYRDVYKEINRRREYGKVLFK